MQVVADGAHHHLTGVEAHTHVQLDTLPVAHLFRIRTHSRLHAKSGVTGAHGVVFMRHRRPEHAMMPSPST